MGRLFAKDGTQNKLSADSIKDLRPEKSSRAWKQVVRPPEIDLTEDVAKESQGRELPKAWAKSKGKTCGEKTRKRMPKWPRKRAGGADLVQVLVGE